MGIDRKDLSTLLQGVDKKLPIILLDHQPYNLSEAEKNGVDLQLSGHTHKGQISPGNLITKKVYEVDWGYEKKGNFNIYVSSGVGTWGPPIRTGSHSEIVDIYINFMGK
jgi:predicted MPP superfamily phosphohydrolase